MLHDNAGFLSILMDCLGISSWCDIDSLKMFLDFRSLSWDAVTEISTWKWEESTARSVKSEFYHINVKPQVLLWSEVKKIWHQRNNLLAMQIKAEKQTLFCNGDIEKLRPGWQRDICGLWKAQLSTNYRPFTRRGGTVTDKHDSCRNGTLFQLNYVGKAKSCPFSVIGLLTPHIVFVPTIKFKSPKVRHWNTMLTANVQFCNLNLVANRKESVNNM